MFYVQIKSDVFKENTVFWVYLLSCKKHKDYKCIEI